MKTRILAIFAVTCGLSLLCLGQSSAPYNQGSVWELSMIKTKAGLNDEYLKQITTTVKPVYEEALKQKIILSYKILNGEASDSHDFNILILVEYPNYAALDTQREKMDPVLSKVMGSDEQRKNMMVKRLDVREILGTKTMREITLK